MGKRLVLKIIATTPFHELFADFKATGDPIFDNNLSNIIHIGK